MHAKVAEDGTALAATTPPGTDMELSYEAITRHLWGKQKNKNKQNYTPADHSYRIDGKVLSCLIAAQSRKRHVHML